MAKKWPVLPVVSLCFLEGLGVQMKMYGGPGQKKQSK